ncbi:MAG: hypothetical protein WCC86_09955 [Methanoregula sp.]|uniref:hypothetical protein n=1 Tax=Methanoregula sp. TaxID=2052170 RepID=UPI003BAF3BAF
MLLRHPRWFAFEVLLSSLIHGGRVAPGIREENAEKLPGARCTVRQMFSVGIIDDMHCIDALQKELMKVYSEY